MVVVVLDAECFRKFWSCSIAVLKCYVSSCIACNANVVHCVGCKKRRLSSWSPQISMCQGHGWLCTIFPSQWLKNSWRHFALMQLLLVLLSKSLLSGRWAFFWSLAFAVLLYYSCNFIILPCVADKVFEGRQKRTSSGKESFSWSSFSWVLRAWTCTCGFESS